MHEARWISAVEKGLFVKFGLLTLLVFGLVFASPAAQLLKAGAHKICAATLMKDSGCPTGMTGV
jgi:hypothetical protein